MALTAAERMRASRARKRAVKEAEARAAGVKAEQDQAALLPLADLVEKHVELPSAAARGRHRAYLQVLESRFPAPLGRLAAIFAQEPEALSKRLVCTKLEAQRIILDAATRSLPYWHQAQPTAIQMSGAPVAPVQVVISGAVAEQLGLTDESEEDQRVIEGEAA
ncbi:hypothetical protein GXW78_16955 [Roseomonas terrae]|uniref:Uncharacterized protein n=1 Tax=Neoroseomonas terrae TaxID=424799 RepID=A0ABS5EK63_9PROT|nr:hypothetical protein [Neoroseomonas terrae]MBR0651365.1 hypothetical protein [Neoroseomonas terrae]